MFTLAIFALIGPLTMEEIAIAGGIAILLPSLMVWLKMRGTAKRLRAESAATLEKLRSESEATLKAEQAKAATQAAADKKTATEAAARFTDIEQRFTTHREVAERRANDASQQMTRLEAELAKTKEIAAQLAPTQSRIKDLEIAVAAEQGRVKAQEQTLEATNARAADFEKRMIEAQEIVLKRKTEAQELEGELRKVRAEQAAYAAAGGAEAELAKAREVNQQAEAKIANLQRALKAAEARTEMVQKEFMNAVGVASAPISGASAAATSSDKKVRDLEEKLAHLEAESRKRAREDGYKIAELEYRLSDALEAAGKQQTVAIKEEPKAEVPPPTPPPVVEETPASAVEVAPPPAIEVPVVEAEPDTLVEISASAVEVTSSTVVDPVAPEMVAVPEPEIIPPATAGEAKPTE